MFRDSFKYQDDADKAAIKEEVSQVLSFLMDKAVIRKIKTDNGTEVYEFYTEEESKVAQIIKNQKVDDDGKIEEAYRLSPPIFASLHLPIRKRL